jgi:DNA-binding response OmpR family regulator
MIDVADEFHMMDQGLHALVVDDDPGINRLLQARLLARGYHVTSASSGEAALAQMAQNNVDIVFLDVSLPGISGLDVLGVIRERYHDTAVVITTAFGSERVAIDAMRMGADDYLRKPFEPSEFKSVLKRTVSRLLLNRQNAALRLQLDEKHRQLEAELVRAANVQSDLLPYEMPIMAGFEMAAECVPAHEVGGDFYDWQHKHHNLLSLWLCDVMGKGMPAALLMATVRAVMRAVVRGSPPATALRYVTAALDDDFIQTDQFVTLFMASLEIEQRRLTYVDAGHGHAFMRRANGAVELLPQRGLPLGVMPDTHYTEGTLVFEPGDSLVVYSDGVIDARPDLELTPQKLSQYLDGTRSALAMVDRVVTLLSPVGVPPDDFTVIVLRCND